MSRTTIDFGIDLGTTNSAIAVLRGTVPDVIKSNMDTDITPSAVFIDRRGILVGQLAKNRQEHEDSGDDVYIEFKRRMGTNHKYAFKTAARTMLPEEVSAEVLKSLRGDVQQRLGEDMQATVITVPAIFEQNQCAATIKAGQLAGFVQCPLLQEPVAAALAYGFQSDVTKEYWLIFDFGGGTFDAAIMKAEDGSISVVNHGGDNYLGGSDFDWAIIDQLIIPELQANFNLPDFSRSNKRWRTAFAVVKRATEIAKIQLSRSETAFIEDCKFKDSDGKVIDAEFKITRNALAGIAEPFIMRSVEICKRVLKEKGLSPSAIEKVILVGGPTLAPYFREILHAQLGIKLDYSVDPLTVVAKGAAVFAGTQRLENGGAPRAVAGEYAIDLKYKPVGSEEDPTVRGEVSSVSGSSVEGFSVEFVNKKSLWRSGKIPLKTGGKFKVNLLAEKGSQNVFTIDLLDAKGSKQIVQPDTISYTMGMAMSEQPFCNDVAVSLGNNERAVFFKKGDAYPATHTDRQFKTTQTVRKGENGDMLRIPVVEGNEAKADWNRKLGELVISGTHIRRDVPAGSDLEVTLHAKGPGSILAKAYIPLLDEEFEAVIAYDEKGPDVAALRKQYSTEAKRLKTLVSQSAETDDDDANALLVEVPNLDDINGLIDTAQGDPDSAKKAEKRLIELRIHLDKAEDLLKWPALVTEANKALDDLDSVIEKHGTDDHRDQAAKFRVQIVDLIVQKRTEPLRKKMEQVNSLRLDILVELPGWWVGYFNYLVGERDKMRDQDSADRLINQGQLSVNKGNVQGLRNAVVQLLALLPQEVQEAVQRGFGSGVVK